MRRSVPIGAAVALVLLGGTCWGAAPAKLHSKLRPARAPVAQLDRARAVQLPGGAVIYQYRQFVDGVPVVAAAITVNDPPGAAPRVVSDSTSAGVEHQPPARIDAADAIRLAERSVASERLLARPSPRLAIQPGAGGTLVWQVDVPSARPLGDFEVQVDARSGEVLGSRDLLRDFRRGHARIFDPNPVVQHGGFSGLRHDHHDRNTRLLTTLRRGVRLRHILGGQSCLRGRFVHALRGHRRRETCKGNLRWNAVRRADDRFEALMAYYHVDRAQRYIRSLGFRGSDGIDARRQPVIVDAFRDDNSFYLPGDRRIRYGSGGVDDAEDADVIVHEYGHAMQDDQAPTFLFGRTLDVAALAEGSADYWAAVMSARARGTTELDDVCIFEWDGTLWGTLFPGDQRFCGRRADNPKAMAEEKAHPIDCSSNDGRDEHCVGTVWSSALWKLRGELGVDSSGRVVMDRDYLAAQFMYTRNETFQKAAKHLERADEDLYPAGVPGDDQGEHFAAIDAEMQARGFL